MCEICSKLKITHQNDVEDDVLEFLLLNLNIFHTFCKVFIAASGYVFVRWVHICLWLAVFLEDSEVLQEFNLFSC